MFLMSSFFFCNFSHISSKTYEDDFESVVNKFFVHLFPVAYHHAVHTELGAGGTMPAVDAPARDFHVDYKKCLTESYKELQPFGEVPKMVTRSLVQSVDAATTFVRALDQGAEVLAGIEALDSDTLAHMCKARLVKMSYCASCKGLNSHHAKPCYGFCVNVMR
jgi:dally